MSKKVTKTILISAGGTGGHVFPALSVAKILAHKYDIVWIGGVNGIENKIVPENNFLLERINISGLRGKGFLKYILLPFMLLRSMWQAGVILFKHNPDVVIGFGGYATFPIGVMAWLLHKPNLIHEQNAVAGLTNKILAKIATRTLVAFPDVLQSKYVLGNPVRNDIVNLAPPEIRYTSRSGGLNVLIVGGSLGAKALNEILPIALANLKNINKIIHQVGRGDVAVVKELYVANGVTNVEVLNFIDDMAVKYTNCDIMICRSGASTVAEITTVGIASILVPYPYAVDDHQTHNASLLVKSGGAILMPQVSLTSDGLHTVLRDLTREKCLDMAIKVHSLEIEDSAQKIAENIESFIG